mmetsp:Transcript_12273/g.18821  ORF Transcript_12273/g.18821 Transcript_12273/m.18821 type:complete len:640 (-) Transcript_12273:51-1970(-)|eukprot:CAMPEP_0178903356 /NCGR_PEP_ID=MMETSP0786-20121207/5112_1 /TAXON_ID=186022 /ORGANISM="Thalassionema frauenfeldii, Strain CCMP 1798" /LENGTH=639 /DNA_ID=CAMNT_0020574719 /DNA_START=154 /DNA_END=2073 /DNA_ORIENTATION=+
MIRTVAKRSAAAAGGILATSVVVSAAYAYNEYINTPEDQISKHHTMHSIYYQSLTNLFMSKLGSMAIKEFESDCKDAINVNEALLLKLMQRCKDTAYGKDHKLVDIISREDFRRKHPITTHDHYQVYIDRVYQGEENVMFPETPRMIGLTSGTSGSHKYIPVPPLQRKVFFTKGIAITFDALQNGVQHPTNHALQWPNLQKSCKLMHEPNFTYTPNNIMVGPNSSRPKDNKGLLKLYTTPEMAFEVRSENELLFLHALYALMDPNLGFIEANFCNRILNFFVVLDENWDKLVKAIETGSLPKDLKIENDIRKELELNLEPDFDRAQELKQIRRDYKDALVAVKENNDASQPSLARRLWPNLHTILASETGTFQIYGEKLRAQYIGQDIIVYSPLYAATEGLIGVNPDIHGKSFVLHPNAMFYEFYPIDETKDDDVVDSEKTLFIEQLEVGKEYEVIITNLTGLYRYRFGDVVRCVGYHHEAPVVEVAYRKGQFLNASGERTSEETFYKALSRTATKDWGLTLKDYTTVEYSLKGNRKPRYVLFVELSEDMHGIQPFERLLTKKEKMQLDKALGVENKSYQALRDIGRLHPIEVITLRRGTFEKVRHEMTSIGVGITQMKQPRVTRNKKLIKILEEGKNF